MKIRSVELTNFRKFVGTVRVDTIGDNVNVLVGRNELGKSTLLQAINGVIFEKARSTASHVKAFRHFVNGTVPEVKLAFDVTGKSWTIHKRFAGQAGKAKLTCSDGRVFEDDAAEAELQRLLGFNGGRGGGEPGIWGTLWVQQGQSFGDTKLNEQAQQTIQGCLEAQVGLVTGGARGQKIPKAVREALDEIQSQRGARGRFKEALERLNEVNSEITELESKAKGVSELLTDLARNRRDLKDAHSTWDETAHGAELEGERNKRVTAATVAAEIARARDATRLAAERAANARQMVEDRTRTINELVGLELDLAALDKEAAAAIAARSTAKGVLDTAEGNLADLRTQVSKNAASSRTLDRIRTAVGLNTEILQHQATLDKAVALDREAMRHSELVGSIAATEQAVARIEEAVTEMSAADAAANAVATTVSFAIAPKARDRVSVDERALGTAEENFSLLVKTTIAITEIGTITVEPQIKNRTTLLKRRQDASDELKASLEAAGVPDLFAARIAAAQRREHERNLAQMQKDLASLAPGNRQRKLAPGQEALNAHIGELRGRLRSELEALKIADLPHEDTLSAEIEKTHYEGARLEAEVARIEAALSGPQEVLAQADRLLRKVEDRVARLKGTTGTRKADLEASRATHDDVALVEVARNLGADASEKERALAEKEKTQGETVEAIGARIKRLESAGANHHRSISALTNDVTRLTALVEANEGAGVEEMLIAALAERERLSATVAEFEQEAAVLKLLLEVLETAEREAKNRYLAPVVGRVQPYLKMLLPGADIVLDENLQIVGIQREGQTEEFEVLSGGTQEQLAVLTRIAFAELLLGQDRPATVILDDALAFSDDDRIESMFDVLMRAGENVQIIVLTCRKKLFTRLGAAPLEIRRAS